MLRVSASHPLRQLAFVLAALVLLAGCSTTSVLSPAVDPLESDKYASVVIDANSGRILFESASNEPRHPASLTKMMTLYLLFEAMDAGLLDRYSQIPISAEAASRPPSKLGLKPGQSIDVQTAILALCVKSANDVAAAVAEYLGGSEEQFAAMMTVKARQLGMHSTTFRNASGLPDSDQITTAHDMAVLAVALRTHFPHQYHNFANRSFEYGGKTIRGHNHLLSREGVNGIKTGYIRASGFNVATSAARGGRRIIAIVMGGESAKERDGHMEELIEHYLPRAAIVR
ncbi:D-alanyl-D-alanine carboxypeptidase family protein [Chelativorans sp. YIM 93263]|uniref:D-alanyl-D-alanine carboxypeptidase family protein n=1 Tax=Chelativorans sp. YIM 93263 TaxID=2906648 RepID=UPI002378E0E6|nr:D-alanyl-D-alanine carboxypeptidase family protein [Chelativorans sp. YIM 93263]